MMVNNSTNINKTKESLNSGQQFNKYQFNKLSPLILTELTVHKKTTTCDVEIEVLTWDSHTNVAG